MYLNINNPGGSTFSGVIGCSSNMRTRVQSIQVGGLTNSGIIVTFFGMSSYNTVSYAVNPMNELKVDFCFGNGENVRVGQTSPNLNINNIIIGYVQKQVGQEISKEEKPAAYYGGHRRTYTDSGSIIY